MMEFSLTDGKAISLNVRHVEAVRHWGASGEGGSETVIIITSGTQYVVMGEYRDVASDIGAALLNS